MAHHRHKVHEKARGGKAHHGKMDRTEEEHEVEHEAGLKRGGKAKHHGHKAHGGKAHHRKARGGSAGSDKHPFSSAHEGSGGYNPPVHKG